MSYDNDLDIAEKQWQRYTYCRDHGHLDFVRKADRCEDFFANRQWEESDLAALRQQNRPALTINKIMSTIGTILGEQIYNRNEILVRPTSGSPAEVADALTKVWMQISQNNQLPWVRSDVFADGIIRSRGFYEVRIDFDDSMQGEVRIDKLNSKNVLIDPDAEEYDPQSWRDVIITRWLSLDDIEVKYGKAKADKLADRDSPSHYGNDSVDITRDRFAGRSNLYAQYEGDDSEKGTGRNIRVLERQHRKLSTVKHFVDMQNGDTRPVPESWDDERILASLERSGGQFALMDKQVMRIRWTVTADEIVLHDDWSPYQYFTVVPYFPYFRYGDTVGIVESLLGSQELLNKTLSQELHVVNTTANSGWLVEAGSLHTMSIQELEETGSKTGSVIEYNKNSTPPQKIQPNQVPTGLDRLSYKAEEHIKTISGVSDSMQGFDREDVAAKAIAYKQQRGAVNLTKPMDNLERTDWILARTVFALVQEYYTEPRIINITHDDVQHEQESIEVNQPDPVTGVIANDLTIGEYDYIVTSTPHRASLEDSQFEQARALREIGVQIPDSVLIENSRLLHRADIIKSIQGDQESPDAQARAELQRRNEEASVANLEAEVQLKIAKAREMSEPQNDELKRLEIELKRWEAEARHATDMAKIELEREKFTAEAQAASAEHSRQYAEELRKRAAENRARLDELAAQQEQQAQQEQPPEQLPQEQQPPEQLPPEQLPPEQLPEGEMI